MGSLDYMECMDNGFSKGNFNYCYAAIQKGNTEVARIHAENAIRQKNQAINFLRMSARVTKSMAGVVKSMDATLKSMNLEKISALMDKFEQQFETLDVQTAQMEDTMSSTTTLTTPQNQVDMLLQEMADEAGMNSHKDWHVFAIKCEGKPELQHCTYASSCILCTYFMA
ncbi:Charged multivesicular body protein 1b-2, partial [Ophiophagus hannah]